MHGYERLKKANTKKVDNKTTQLSSDESIYWQSYFNSKIKLNVALDLEKDIEFPN